MWSIWLYLLKYVSDKDINTLFHHYHIISCKYRKSCCENNIFILFSTMHSRSFEELFFFFFFEVGPDNGGNYITRYPAVNVTFCNAASYLHLESTASQIYPTNLQMKDMRTPAPPVQTPIKDTKSPVTRKVCVCLFLCILVYGLACMCMCV